MGLFDELFGNTKKDKNLEDEMDMYCLEEWQKKRLEKENMILGTLMKIVN